MPIYTTLRVVTQPATEPVTPDEARRHCRIDFTEDDDLIAGFITTSRIMCEQFLNRALITQTLLWTFLPQNPAYPQWRGPTFQPWLSLWSAAGQGGVARTFELPRPPAQSVASVVLRDSLGADYSLSAAVDPTTGLPGYEVDLTMDPARLRIEPSAVNAIIVNNQAFQPPLQHMQVQFKAGYGDISQSVPQPILTAILFNTAWFYEHRGDADVERGLSRVAESLLWPYRSTDFGS